MDERVAIAKRIKDLRGNLSQKKFGERMGFSQGQIGHIETGRTEPSLKFLLQLSKLYNISIDYILKGFEPYDRALSKSLNSHSRFKAWELNIKKIEEGLKSMSELQTSLAFDCLVQKA